MGFTKNILISIVVYDNEEEVLKYLHVLKRQTAVNKILVCITYNKGKDFVGFRQKAVQNGIDIHCFNPNRNLGYLQGCLYGIQANNHTNEFEWIVIGNTDIMIYDKCFFEKILKEKVSSNVWCLAPDVILKKLKIHQNPMLINRYSKKQFLLRCFIYNHNFLFKLYFALSNFKKKRLKNSAGKKQIIYSAHGSFFLVRPACINAVSVEEDKIFLYGEEILLSEIIRENNKVVLYDPSFKVIHDENQVTQKIGSNEKQKWFKISFHYLRKRFY